MTALAIVVWFALVLGMFALAGWIAAHSESA